MPVTDPRYELTRDLEGYGEHSIDPQWPNGAKICISFLLNYEEGAERTVLNGDAHSEPYLWEKGASSTFTTGARHISAESEYEYGSRSGAWRLLRLFKEMGWNFTSWAVAQAMEKNPSFARACVRDGHEIAAHGLRWLDIGEMSIEEESEYIKENALSLERTTGVFPKGYFYGRASPNIRGLYPEVMKKMGKKLLYSSESCFNDDVPYWMDLPWEQELPESEREGLLVIPYNYDCNDGKFHMSPGFTGVTYLGYLKSTFDMLYREGRAGSPKLMNIPMHSRIIGKPGRAEDLRTFMLYVKEKAGDEAWVATREQIATHFKKTFPYVPGHLAPGRKIGDMSVEKKEEDMAGFAH